MEKEIHFYRYYDARLPYRLLTTWTGTESWINIGIGVIHTTQMGLLHTRLFKFGYRIFIHESEIDSYEIVLGGNNERTNREIREGHNLFKMWQSGEFERKDR